MHRRRGWAIVGVCLLGGCFKELPTLPGSSSASSGEGDTTAAPTTGEGASTGAGVTSAPQTTDEDPGTTGPTAPTLEGLFACTPAVCEPWLLPACDGACGPLDEAGRCALELMRDRGSGRADVRACDGGCVRTAVAVRGGGTDEADRQAATEVDDGLVDYTDVSRCTLREPAFFADCLGGLTAACVDPAQWFVGCEAAAEACA